MDPSDLLPGLAKMLEARLRPRQPDDPPRYLGYHMATAMMVSVWGFLTLLLPLGAVSLALGGLFAIFDWQPVVIDGLFATHMLISFGTICVFLAVSTLVNHWLNRRHMRKVRDALAESQRAKRELHQQLAKADAELASAEAITEELARRGGHDLDEIRAEVERRASRRQPPDAERSLGE